MSLSILRAHDAATITFASPVNAGAPSPTYNTRLRSLLQKRSEGTPQPGRSVRSITHSGGVTTCRFLNFIFGEVATDTCYAQLRGHSVSMEARGGSWWIVGAGFDLATVPNVYPKAGQHLKIYYVLQKRADSREVHVMRPGVNWYIELSIRPQDVTGASPIVPAISSHQINTHVPSGGSDPGTVFNSIRWNLAAKIEWERVEGA